MNQRSNTAPLTDPGAAQALCAKHWFVCATIDAIGEGRINDTFVVQRDSDRKRFVLQKFNTNVFLNAPVLMRQTEQVVKHIESKQAGWVPQLEPTVTGESFVQVQQERRNELWRLWVHVDNARTGVPETIPEGDPSPWLYAAAAAFAHTHKLLADLPATDLVDPIPGLFDLARHFAVLDDKLATLGTASLDPLVVACVDLVQSRRSLAEEFAERTGVIHGDCKPQNLMYKNGSAEVAAVLDLDTVMQGHWAWDFGDLIRSTAVIKGQFELARFAPLVEGFVSAMPDIHHVDPKALVRAPLYAASCLGLRYLNDHLSGDRFFKVKEHGDNLRRARTRLGLLAQFDQSMPQMEAAVTKLLAGT